MSEADRPITITLTQRDLNRLILAAAYAAGAAAGRGEMLKADTFTAAGVALQRALPHRPPDVKQAQADL